MADTVEFKLKKSYIYILIVALVVLIAFFVLRSGDEQSSDNPTPVVETVTTNLETETESVGYLKILENNIDVGDISMKNGKTDIKFEFENQGDGAVTLLKGSTSCMCTVGVISDSQGNTSPTIVMRGHRGWDNPLSMVVEPGETMQFLATFDPNAHGPNATGPITRDVTIETDSSKTPQLKFRFQGNVVK